MDLLDTILDQIKHNKLDVLDYELLVSQLTVLNNKPYIEIKRAVDDLTKSGRLKLKNLSSNNTASAEKNISKPKKSDTTGNFDKFKKAPKSPYYFQQELGVNNVDLAYDILARKDQKKNTKISRVEGKIQITSKGYGFLLPTDIGMEDIFISEKNLNSAMHNDKVIVSVVPTGGRRMEGSVIQVVERGNEKVVGILHRNKKLAYVTPDDVKFGKDIYVSSNNLLSANDGDKVVVKIIKFYASKRNPDGEIIEVLGKPNNIETEVLAILRSYNLYNTFPKKVQESAAYIPEEISKDEYKHRLDYTSKICFTIDGEDTRDIDDAISLEINKSGNRVLGVHIADVGEYVKKDNVFDKEAYKRGTSVYFPNLVLPMLPRELSNGICSLNERVDRLALSCFMEFDSNANLIDYKITESIINSKKRFTYTEVQAIFDGDKSFNKELTSIVLGMKELSKQLEKGRVQRGAIEFNIPEVKVEINDLGDVTGLFKREHNDSHKLIESFMIAANETIATHFVTNNIPFVYRIHEKPDTEKMLKLVNMVNSFGHKHTLNPDDAKPIEIQRLLISIKNEPSEYVLNKIALRTMKKAKYSPDCIGHYGLASPKYCHFTSPIRRYPDLTIHRIIKSHLRNELNDQSKKLLKEFVYASSIQSSETERNAEAVERDVDDLYRVFYMAKHLNEEFDAVISSVTNFGIFVELDNTVEGLIRIENLPQDQYEFIDEKFCLKGYNYTYTIGDKLKVKAVRADILTREIDFILATS